MELEFSSSSTLFSTDSADDNNTPHRKRVRYRRRSRHKKRTVSERVTHALGKFFTKNKTWIFGILSVIILIAVLLLIFNQIEQDRIRALSQPEVY
jgi:uncharacterized membrane protein